MRRKAIFGNELNHGAGYILFFDGVDWVFKHRYIMESQLGRKLKNNEVVHHIDGNKKNNNINNLQLLGWSEHARLTVNTVRNGKINPFRYNLPEKEICELYSLGFTLERLSENYSVSVWVILDRLKKNGVQIRRTGYKKGDVRNKGQPNNKRDNKGRFIKNTEVQNG